MNNKVFLILLVGLLKPSDVHNLPTDLDEGELRAVTLCDLLVGGKPNEDGIDEIFRSDIKFQLSFGSIASIEMTADNLTISGLSQIEFTDCEIDADNSAIFLADKISQLDIVFSNYNLDGLFDEHIHIYGEGMASVFIEDFSVAIRGNFTRNSDDNVIFDYLQIDLDMYQWTVIFEHFMDGTDMGVLFNEFFSEVGTETIDTLEGVLNEGGPNDGLKDVVNLVLTSIQNNIKNGTTIDEYEDYY